MPTLHDRFTDLAEDAPASPTPAGIWSEGRRLARVRRIGTAVVIGVTVLGLAAVGGISAHRSSAPAYTDGSGVAPALPSTIHVPSEWLDVDSRPPGQLSMVIPTKNRSWTGYDWGLVGVSATTGAYGFLDLPDYGAEGALSPDGRHYAYWLGRGAKDEIYGLAIYDTQTGALRRWRPPAGETPEPDGLRRPHGGGDGRDARDLGRDRQVPRA